MSCVVTTLSKFANNPYLVGTWPFRNGMRFDTLKKSKYLLVSICQNELEKDPSSKKKILASEVKLILLKYSVCPLNNTCVGFSWRNNLRIHFMLVENSC